MNITAIHALVGGLAAQLGGGSFTTGATGAASAEISRNLVKDLSPDAQQWASVIIGGAAAKVVGGNAQVGASTALSGTVNNDLAHKITGITKGILNGVEEDAKGLIDFIVNYQETIENLKDTANAIYDLGKEQGFGAVFAEIGNAIGGDWVNKYDTIENEYINGMIDENTYDYRIGMLAGEVTYFIASTVAEPEKLAVNPKLLTKVAKLSKVEKLSEFTLEPVIVTAKRIEGSSNAKYLTRIENKVTGIEKTELPEWVAKSFTDGNYRTVVTNDNVILYRTFGGKADAGGGFATTMATGNRIQAKIDTALLPEWGNTRMYEAVIVVPKGQMLNIGKVAEQYTSTGANLAGQADQILLPQNWPLEWIKEIRVIPSK